MKDKEISGIYVPICTPYSNNKVDSGKLANNMEKFADTDLKGYFALGSNGENCLLKMDEKEKILTVILEKRNKDQLVMAGCSNESTSGTISLTKWAAKMGADFASIQPPHYFKKAMTDAAILNYYTEVAENSPIPVVIYNAPGFTGGVNISVSAMAELSLHPNITGMKESSSSGPGLYLTVVSEDFSVMAGSANIFLSTLSMGGVGGVLSIANFHPRACCHLYDLFIQGDADKTRRFQYSIIMLNQAVSGKYGVAGVKAAMDIVGMYGGNPRLPLLPIKAEDKKKIYDSLKKFAEECSEFGVDLVEPC